MEIDVKVSETKFFNLKKGDTFSFQGYMWMKLEHTVRDIENCHLANAVSLKSGAVAEFNDNDKVIFVRTKLINA